MYPCSYILSDSQSDSEKFSMNCLRPRTTIISDDLVFFHINIKFAYILKASVILHGNVRFRLSDFVGDQLDLNALILQKRVGRIHHSRIVTRENNTDINTVNTN